MAFCPACSHQMGKTDTACAECGYDFPHPGEYVSGSSLAFTRFADAVLAAASVFALLAAVASLLIGAYGTLVAVIDGNRSQIWVYLAGSPLASLGFFAMYVLFVRVQTPR